MKSKKIGALVIDFIITTLIMEIPFFILIILPLVQGNNPSNIILKTLFSTLIAFQYLIFSDMPKNGSIGKRILKLKVIDATSKEAASSKQRFLRNITWLLNWIEVFFFLIKGKRIGDIISNTEVVEV